MKLSISIIIKDSARNVIKLVKKVLEGSLISEHNVNLIQFLLGRDIVAASRISKRMKIEYVYAYPYSYKGNNCGITHSRCAQNEQYQLNFYQQSACGCIKYPSNMVYDSISETCIDYGHRPNQYYNNSTKKCDCINADFSQSLAFQGNIELQKFFNSLGPIIRNYL